MGVPVGVRANLALALAEGGYDVVHGFEPGLPSLSYLALRNTDALSVARIRTVSSVRQSCVSFPTLRMPSSIIQPRCTTRLQQTMPGREC